MTGNNRGSAYESLERTKSVAEGLFHVSGSSRGLPGFSPFDQYASNMGLVSPDDPTRPPDAFDVGLSPVLRPLQSIQNRAASRRCTPGLVMVSW